MSMVNPRTDKMMRVIVLQRIRRALNHPDYNRLDLKNLDPLRREVALELEKGD